MIKQTLLIASAAAATMVAIPASANASHRHYQNYSQPYYGQQAYGYGYQPYYGQRAYGYGYQPYYQQQRYYGRQRAYYGHQRCGNGTTGLIVGGAAGALLGREVDRGGNRYYGRGSGTTGAIIGGAIGALVGREVARSC